MHKPLSKTAFLVAAAVAASLAMPALAAEDMKEDMKNTGAAKPGKKEKCYGINEAGKNDCATRAHSCAGEAKEAHDPNSWVFAPAGTCEKSGGSLTPKKEG